MTLSLLPDLMKSMAKNLNEEQTRGLEILCGENNVFLTGGAGTGKSYLMREYLKGLERDSHPVVASTGAAAVLVGGRTFHSFFGLGIMEGGPVATIERALKDKRLTRRLKKAQCVVIDEISMISGHTLAVAEEIARLARDSDAPWGGLKIIAVGDFAQLPPITRGRAERDWAFLNPVWEKTDFKPIHLKTVMRAQNDFEFCKALEDARYGRLTPQLESLMEWRSFNPEDEGVEATNLYARKVDVERINNAKLREIDSEEKFFDTEYVGDSRFINSLKKQAPVSERLSLKEGAFVMIRQNDPKFRWVNGSLGHINRIEDDNIEIALLKGGTANIEKSSFSMLDADGKEVASAKNFPLSLAYAITIHKAQGATLDRAVISIKGLWEPGQAYVALSRLKSSDGLFVAGWDKRSFITDPKVIEFHEKLEA